MQLVQAPSTSTPRRVARNPIRAASSEIRRSSRRSSNSTDAPQLLQIEEQTIMPVLRMRAGDVSIPAFDLRDEAPGHQELKRPVNGGRPGRAGVPELQRFDQFAGTRRTTALPEQLQYLAPQRDTASATLSAGACCPRKLGSAQGPGWIDRNAVTLSLVAFKHKKHYNILFFERNKGLPLVAGGGRRNGFDMDTSGGRCPAHRISAHLVQAGDDPDREGPVPAARVPVDDRQPQERSA